MNCPKCGADMEGPKYEQLYSFERLTYTCKCGFEGYRPCNDSTDQRVGMEKGIFWRKAAKPEKAANG